VGTFSGYGLFNFAYEIGVEHLAKFESCAEFRATTLVLANVWIVLRVSLRMTPPTGKSDDVRAVLEFMATAIFGWLTHFRGVRLGHLDMQVRSGRARRGVYRSCTNLSLLFRHYRYSTYLIIAA
jgi:hypothetical protein